MVKVFVCLEFSVTAGVLVKLHLNKMHTQINTANSAVSLRMQYFFAALFRCVYSSLQEAILYATLSPVLWTEYYYAEIDRGKKKGLTIEVSWVIHLQITAVKFR